MTNYGNSEPNGLVLRILGIRGVPAAHGGFETFAEALSLHLVTRGWKVIVYCQEDEGTEIWRDDWRGVVRIHIPVRQTGTLGTVIFDWKATRHAAKHRDCCLTLGYNTAAFTSLLRLNRLPNLINMDGIEWSRAKWGRIAKLWFWLNDWAGCWLASHLIADHPEIKRHLCTRVRETKIDTIAYGAERVLDISSDPLREWDLHPKKFLTLIARAEPENSILEVVRGFSKKRRGVQLVVLGRYDKSHTYQMKVLEAASDEVKFVGALYDKSVVQALRFHCLAYVHGHRAGGTNPSLVEALGAGNAIIAHDNVFNRWVAGDSAAYFTDENSFASLLDKLLADRQLISDMQSGSVERFTEGFTWERILEQYEVLLSRFANDCR